jgi:hypothetical protein
MSVTISGDTGLAGAATGALNGSLGATTPSTVVATTISGSNSSNTVSTLTLLNSAPTYPIITARNTGGDAFSVTTRATGGGSVISSTDFALANYSNMDIIGDNIRMLTGSSAIERMRIDSSGNVGIGVTPSAWQSGYRAMQFALAGALWGNKTGTDIYLSSNYIYNPSGANKYQNNGYANYYAQANGSHVWFNAPSGTAGDTITFTQAMTLDASGNLLVGTTSGVTKKLNVAGVIKNTGGGIGGDVGAGQGEMGGDGTNGCQITGKGSTNDVTLYSSGGSIAARVPTGTQNFTVVGALSKGSGSFRIDHPLPQLEATHQLVHSFIEGPQADLIYRGKVNLVNGTATVNIDEASTMTEGTFIELCRDVQCFTTNESDWTAIRGSVTNNILTIEAQDNTSTASISWMVIGERQDKHILETDWTDENGKVIVEPLKVIDEVLEAK